MAGNVQTLLELVWAAGFYDGEGCTGAYHYNRTQSLHIRAYVNQSSDGEAPEVLVRFQQAIGEGHIYGPHKRKSELHRPRFYWVTYGPAAVRVVEKMWPYLSTVKRRQAIDAWVRVKEWEPPVGYGRWPVTSRRC